MPINVITGREISAANSVFSEFHNGHIRSDQSVYLTYFSQQAGEMVRGVVHKSAVAPSEQFITGGSTSLISQVCEIPNLPLDLRLFFNADTPRDVNLFNESGDGHLFASYQIHSAILGALRDNGYADATEGSFRIDGGIIRATDNSGVNRGREYDFIHIPVKNSEGQFDIVKTPFLATTIFRSRFIKFNGQQYFTSRNVFEQLKSNSSCVVSGNVVYLTLEDSIVDGNVPRSYACDYHASHYDTAFGQRNLDVLNDPDVKFRVGFEIEKVDAVAKFLISQKSFKKTLPSGNRIIVEEDSSLGREGFEAVTSIFDLFAPTTLTDCDHPYFKTILDAKALSVDPRGSNGALNFQAGGHVNLSVRGLTTDELNKALEPFAGLLYAVHARNLRRYANFQDKSYFNRGRVAAGTPAFENKSNGLVEIRLFGPVLSTEAFKVRVHLLRAICTLIESGNVKNFLDVNRILRDPNTPLSKAAAAELERVEISFSAAFGEDVTAADEVSELIRKRAMLFSAAMDAQNFGLSKQRFGVFADRAQRQLSDVFDSLHETTKSRLEENYVGRSTLFG